MHFYSPYIIAALLILGACAFSAASSAWRRSRILGAYEEITGDIRRLAGLLGGEISAEGQDLVVSGRYRNRPLSVRFSNSEQTAGMQIRIHAPVCVSLFILPRRMHRVEGRVAVLSGDRSFDQSFVIRSDEPADAMLFLRQQATLPLIRRICQSSQTLLSFRRGSVELSEFCTAAGAARALFRHLDDMSELAAAAAKLPGSFMVKVEPPRRPLKMIYRMSGALAVAAVLCMISFTGFGGGQSIRPAEKQEDKSGIQSSDLLNIGSAGNWRIARTEDFDTNFLSWLDHARQEPASRIELDSQGTGAADEVAYLLVGVDGSRRLVLLAHNRVVYDSRFLKLSGIAKVPAESLLSVKWLDSGKPSAPPQGDGLLVATDSGKPTDTRIFYLDGDRVASAIPADYHDIRLRSALAASN